MGTLKYFLLALTFALLPTLRAQYSYEFEFEEPNPALEFSLDEMLGDDTYNLFSYPADTIFNQLLNSPDSAEIELSIDNKYSFNIILSDYAISAEFVDDPELIFTKIGTIVGVTNSKVFGVFMHDYFWLSIWNDTQFIKVTPVRAVGESLIGYSDKYIIDESIIDNYTYQINETCNDYYIELSVMGDKSLYDMYGGDTSFIKGAYYDIFYETQDFLMDNFNPENGLLTMRVLSFDVFSSGVFPAYNAAAANYQFQDYMEALHPCYDPDIHVLLTGINSGGISQRGTLCKISPLLEPYAGIAVVGCNGGINFAGISHAHEICHVLGADEYENCPNSSCQGDCVLMCSTNSCNHLFQMDECNRPDIINELNANCTACLTEYTEVDCGHCMLTVARTFDESLMLVRGCPERNRFLISFSFTTDCNESDIQLDINFNKNVISILDKGDFVDIDYDFAPLDGIARLIGPMLTDISPESTRSFTIEVEIKANAPSSGTSILTPILFDFWINDQFFPTQNLSKPKFISPYNLPSSSLLYLSDYFTPDPNGFSLNPGNQTSCTYNNTPFRVFGDFVVDEDYCFNNTYIIMQPDAKLIIQGGVTCTINASKILGCQEMWESIFVEEGASLIVQNGKIEDAATAVHLEKNTTFTSTTSTYHNNNIAISAVLAGPGDIDFHMPGGNRITADDVLPKEPLQGYRAKAGIWLENVNSVSIEGEPPHIEPGMNVIGNLTNGIVLFNTDASINNFHLYDIRSPNPTVSLTDDLPDGHAIYLNGTAGNYRTSIGSADTRDNYINGSHTGIFVKGAEVDIQYCNIHRAISGIILGYKPRGETTITHNLINAINRGVQLRLPTTLGVDISNNRFTMTTSNSIGIEGLSTWGNVSITDNLFLLNKSNAGISLLDCQHAEVTNNTLIFEEISSSTMKGISLEGSFNCQVIDNTILGKDLSNNTVGIYVQDSPNNLVQCNYTDNVNKGDQFTGICSMTYYIGNILRRSDYGLLLGSEAVGSEALMGVQNHRENNWSILNYGNYGAWINTEEIQIIERSRFLLDDSQSNYFPPNIADLINIDWFRDLSHSEYSFDCSSPPLTDCCENFSVPDTIVTFNVNSALKNYQLRRQLYNSMIFSLLDTNSTSSLYNFYLKCDTTDYGRLVNTRFNFIKSVSENPNQRNSYITTALSLNRSVNGEDDFLTLETNSNEILAEYLPAGDIDAFISMEETIRDRADQCPYAYGPGVYMNRAWVKAMDLETNYNDIDACGQIDPRSKESFIRPSDYTRIYPNPSYPNNNITIEISHGPIQVSVIDVYGKVLQRLDNVNEKGKNYLQFRNSGVYFIHVLKANHEANTYKVVILN